jgi:hypothetical protein
MNHKWSIPNLKSTKLDNSTVECVKCGLIRQYVKGLPTYYDKKRDIVTVIYAPICKP